MTVNSMLIRSGGPEKEGNFRNRLLVEGSDDFNVCLHLFQCYKIRHPNQIGIIDKKGVQNLLQSLQAELLGSELENLGIMVDADYNLDDRWKSLRNKLIELGYNSMPSLPTPQGTIIEEDGRPKIGIWLMPNNQIPGMLEHFCSFLIPTNDTLWQIAENALQQVIRQDRRFPEQQSIKALLHTWLAWQEEPGKPVGQAITKRFLDHRAQAAQLFIQWIYQLFNVNESILE
jgi:hypothetical protein